MYHFNISGEEMGSMHQVTLLQVKDNSSSQTHREMVEVAR